MLSLRSKASSFFALTTLILVLLSFLSSPVTAADAAGDGVVLRGARLSVLENAMDLVLAEERTRRKDPLDDLNYYTGGWNISNEHYFASVLYTGSSLFLIAAFWFVLFGIFLLLSCIIGSIVLYTGQGKFHDSTKDTLEYVLGQADSTVDNLKSFSNYLTSAKTVGVDQVFLPKDVQNNIDNVNSLVTSAANTLESATKDNKDDIFHYLDNVGLILIIVAAVMLTLAFLGFLLSICGLQFLVYILVVVAWILVAVTFILCGVFLVLHNVMGDTCVAMNDWVKNPAAHTALDKIIPCVDRATVEEARNQSKEVTFQMVQLVNGIIANVSNVNLPSIAGPLSYNQSGPLVPLLCNPYNPDRTDRKSCITGEVDFTNATQVWKNYECQVSNNTCTTVGRLTPSMYEQMSGAVNVSYGLYHYGPFLTNLVDCTFVRDTFATIEKEHCPDLRLYSRWVYIGLVMVSAAVMLSLIFWVLYARERRHRKYTKLADAAAAAPQTSYENKGP